MCCAPAVPDDYYYYCTLTTYPIPLRHTYTCVLGLCTALTTHTLTFLYHDHPLSSCRRRLPDSHDFRSQLRSVSPHHG